jgi:hypothetical protein
MTQPPFNPPNPPHPAPPQYPYQPIQYATAIYARPGLLTSLGICSIIVGGLSALGSLSGIASGIMYIVMSHMQMTIPTPATAPSTAPSTQPANAFTAHATAISFNISPAASALTIAEGVLSLGAAVLLIVAGSLLLRDSLLSWRLHRLYILIKIPVVVVGAVAMWWVYMGLLGGMMNIASAQGAQVPRSFTNYMAIFEAGFMAVISLIYPIALLIILAGKTSKTYRKLLEDRIAPKA